MDEDILKELGYLSLASRLKRISDNMIHSGRQMYKDLGYDIEPNWFLVFLTLERHEALPVTEIAAKLRFSHPSVITIINKMTKAGYVESRKCSEDGRKQWLSLTEKARKQLPLYKKVWEAGTHGLEKMLAGFDLLKTLDHLETQLEEQSFRQRTFDELDPQRNEQD